MAKKRPPSMEHVLVRHCVAAKRGEFERVSPLLRSGFEHSSSLSSTGRKALSQTRAADRWTIALEHADSHWLPLYSNVADAKTLYEANRESRRSEVVWVRFDAQAGDCDFHWASARKTLIEFSHRTSDPEAWRNCECSNKAIAKMLQARNGQEAFQSLCDFAELVLPAPTVEVEGKQFQIVRPQGPRANKSLGNFVIFSAAGLAAGKNSASDRLAEAIEAGDAKAVKQAIADGASLDSLPDTSLAPLAAAMFRCGYTESWRECAQALIDAGCSVHEGGFEPPVIEACSHLLQEESSIEILKLLIENDADVNVRDQGGLTALDSSACRRRQRVVEFLLKHGADPTIQTRGDKTIIDEMRNRVNRSAKYGKRSEYAPILELLTGKPCEVPAALRPSDAVRAEAARFVRIANARHTRKLLPKEPDIQSIKLSRLNAFETFKPWSQELRQLGFVESCHMITRVVAPLSQTLYTNESLSFDALFGEDGPFDAGGLRLELIAYLGDSHIISVTNKPSQGDSDLRPAVVQSHVAEGATPSELVGRLKELAATCQVMKIHSADAFERYRAGVRAVLDGIRKRTKEIEREVLVRADGTTPRFERVGVYLQPRPGSDPEDMTSAHIATSAIETLTKLAGKSKRRDLCDAVREAALLAALDHLEMAGAIGDEAKISMGIDAGSEFFGQFAKRSSESSHQWFVEPLCQALTLTTSRGRWDDVQTICDGLTPKLYDPEGRFSDDPPVAMAELLAMIANLFRRKPLETNQTLLERVDASRSKHAQLLARVVSAIERADAAEFERAIVASLQHASQQKPRRNWSFDLERALAWHETTLWHIASRQNMPVPNLRPRQRDWLMLPNRL